MASLPGGTVTFVFTDIEGSTELLKELGDGYRDVLSEHRRIVRETFTTAGGTEIDTQGDAFFFVFPRARDAVSAAVEAQRAHALKEWPHGAQVRVRMGLHTGEPAVHDEGYVGLDVVRAARICTVGRGGQVLLSETTRSLLGSGLPAGVSVYPLGERHLRGIDEPERVFELEIEGLEQKAEAPAPVPEEREKREELAPLERDIERRFEDFGTRLAASIEEGVRRKLEGGLGHSNRGQASSNVDDLATRMASLGDEISARIEAALQARVISRRAE